jgi:hypothetical protein
MRVIFVSGPFRAATAWEIEQNVRRAETLALEVWRAGFAAICPHTNTRFFDGAAPDRLWLDGDIEILRRCDALILVPGWERSSGSVHEVAVANDLAIPVFSSVETLVAWNEGPRLA